MDAEHPGASAQGGAKLKVTLLSNANSDGDFISKARAADSPWTAQELNTNRSVMKKLYRHEHREMRQVNRWAEREVIVID